MSDSTGKNITEAKLEHEVKTDPFFEAIKNSLSRNDPNSPGIVEELIGGDNYEVLNPDFPTGASSSMVILEYDMHGEKRKCVLKGLIVPQSWDFGAVISTDNGTQLSRFRDLKREKEVYERLKNIENQIAPFYIGTAEISIDINSKAVFLCMDLFEGQSFKSYLESKENVEVEKLFKIFEQIGAQKAILIKNGIYRPDNNGGNFVINEEGEVVHIDFGSGLSISEEGMIKDSDQTPMPLTKAFLPEVATTPGSSFTSQLVAIYDRISFGNVLLMPLLLRSSYHLFDRKGDSLTHEDNNKIIDILKEHLAFNLRGNEDFVNDLAIWVKTYLIKSTVGEKNKVEYNPLEMVADLKQIFEKYNIVDIQFPKKIEIQKPIAYNLATGTATAINS